MAEFAALLANAAVAGVLLGGFYAAAAVGVSISFGMLGIVNIAHPAFILVSAFMVYVLNDSWGVDPILAGVLMTPLFYILGTLIYEVYDRAFDRRGADPIRSLAFFFGLLFITEVSLSLIFGVDYRLVDAGYIGPTWHLGAIELPLRLLVPFATSLVMLGGLELFLSRSFIGRAVRAVSQDQGALQLMGASPARIKRIAFSLSVASCSLAGALMIIVQTVEPSMGRDYIGRIFAICVLGGAGSLPGTLFAAFVLGAAEELTSTFYGPSWAPAVSFGLLLLTLIVRPAGLLGRA